MDQHQRVKEVADGCKDDGLDAVYEKLLDHYGTIQRLQFCVSLRVRSVQKTIRLRLRSTRAYALGSIDGIGGDGWHFFVPRAWRAWCLCA